ncbi:hypothetical protein N800_05980 [Lysobacter daejeonensis GH1-9]|uniref:LysM domain-containing protein n=2 Tax=Aerolutibacter TaxID=3382701 RepID=A0A0A0EV51_9GAMM|nr:hypothetical protein N800_05980 [Lysobacter daejeonensis GH1-9]
MRGQDAMTQFAKAFFHKDIRTVEFTAGNGDRMLRSGGTLAWLFNNPGNLRPKSKSLYPGQIGAGETKYGRLCIFASVEAGRAEKRALLRRKYNPMTLRKAIFTYAPPADNNDSEAYLSFVKKKTGLSDGVLVEDLSESQLGAMMSAMEQYEGFNAKQDTRKEKWIHVTQVTLSDGARPIAEQSVTIVRGDDVREVKSDAFGRLPLVVTDRPGELLLLQVGRNTTLQCTVELPLPAQSQSFVLLRSGSEYKATLASHNPLPGTTPRKQDPIRYVVQPGDSMQEIARRFKIDSRRLVGDNKATVRDADRIYPGQVLWIHGKGPGPAGAAGNGQRSSPVIPAAQRQPLRQPRSKENQGHPLGVVALDQKRAPWMETAVAELRKWGGTKESVIDDTINYHKQIGISFKSLSVAWCASFVNYCLKTAGYKHSGSAGSQSFRNSANFHKLTAPVYGALVVYSNPKKPGQGHVAFAYCKLKGGDVAVLGGNQGDSITFNSHRGVYIDMLKYKLQGYYVPVAYKAHAEKQLKQGGDLGEEEHTLKTLRAAFGKSAKVTQEDRNTR